MPGSSSVRTAIPSGRCGIRLNEEERFDASEWCGQNTLGFALMEARSMLRKVED